MAIPKNVEYVLVNVKTQKLIPLPYAEITKILKEGSKKLREVHILLGSKPELKKPKRPANPFNSDSRYYRTVSRLLKNNKCSVARANELADRSWSSDKWVDYLTGKGLSVTSKGKWLRL